MDPRLLDEHLLGEEALVQHSLDDLLTRLLGLRLHLVRVRVDLPLGSDDLIGNVLAADPACPWGGGDVHGELARNLVRAAPNLHEHAELVRRRVRVAVDDGAVDGLKPCRPRDDNVLAELGRKLLAFLVELLDGVGALPLHGLEHLDREGEELLVVRDRLSLAADGDDDPELGVVGDPVADLPLGGLAAGSLGCARQPALPEQGLCGFEITVRVLQGALAIHHPGAGQITKLLDESRRDFRVPLRHAPSPSGCEVAAAATSDAGSGSGSASG